MRINVNGFSDIQPQAGINIAELLNGLEIGDIIRAKVLEVSSDEILLRLFDGSLLKAAAGEKLFAKPGQMLTLSVSSKSEGTLYLETVKCQAADTDRGTVLTDKGTDKGTVLMSASFQTDAKTVPLSERTAILSMSDLNSNFQKNAALKMNAENPGLAAAFAKMGILPSTAQFAKASFLMKHFDGFTAEHAAFAITKGITPDGVDNELLAKLLNGNLKLGALLDGLLRLTEEHENNAAQATPTDKGTVPNKGTVPDNRTFPTGNGLTDKGTDKGTVLMSARLQTDTGTVPLSERTASLSALSAKLRETIKEAFAVISPDMNTAGDELMQVHRELNDRLEAIKAAVQSFGLGEKTSEDGIPSGTQPTKDSAVIAVHSSKDETISSANTAQDDIASAAALLDDGAKIINRLNSSNIPYFQMPVNLNGQNATAEIYIMKRQGGKKRIDPENFALLLALDTNHMGRFEAIIEIKSRHVEIGFRTMKPEIINYVKENIKSLHTSLSACGYKLSGAKYALIDRETAPPEMESILEHTVGSNRGKVDIRI